MSGGAKVWVGILLASVALAGVAEVAARRAEAQPAARPELVDPAQPSAAPLAVIGGALVTDPRFTARLAADVVGPAGFSGLVGFAPQRDGPALVRTALSTIARTGAPPPTLHVPPHARGPDVFVIEVDGALLGADQRAFVIDPPAPPPERTPAPFALARFFEGRARTRARDHEEQALVELLATDGFVAGAARRASERLAALNAAVLARDAAAGGDFLRALITELHGLRRQEARRRAMVPWNELFHQLRAEQRLVLLVLTGPDLTHLGFMQTALDLSFPIVRVAPSDLDPRLRLATDDGRPAGIVHTQAADAVWAMLTRRAILPPELAAPPAVLDLADAIESAARARGGIDEALITLAHQWLRERCDFGNGAAPPQALRGFGVAGRLVPGQPAEFVLTAPPNPKELVVRASAKAGTAPPLVLHFAEDADGMTIGTRRMVATVVGPAPGGTGRELLEYRAPPPPKLPIVAWPGFELLLEASAAADPELALTSAELTRGEAAEEGN